MKLLLITLLILALAESRLNLRGKIPKKQEVSDENEGKNFDIKFFENKIDHFSFLTDDNLGFKNSYEMKYLVNDTFWAGKGKNGPIFFYCGNEGDIEMFYENSGFMTHTLAE